MDRKIARRALLQGAASMAGAAMAGAAPWRASRAEGAEIDVDVELIIAVDVSGSIDPEEAQLQRNGYIDAFTDARILRAIKSGPRGRIAVAYVEWADNFYQSLIADWVEIDGEDSAGKFAAHLRKVPINIAQRTSISGAINYCLPLFDRNNFKGTRQVIDISGDGPNNDGILVDVARDAALARKITINGLPIINDRPNRFGFPNLPDLDDYYEGCVIGGRGAFVVVARDFADFATAVKQKLFLEVSGITAERYRDVARAEGFIHPTYWIDGTRRKLAVRPAGYDQGCDVGERQSREFWRRRNFEQ